MTALSLGPLRLTLLDEGRFRLDGGAMFRVVPRVLWERVAPPDPLNRIELAMRPLLVRSGDEVVLIETGIGPELRDRAFRERVDFRPGAGIEAGLAAEGLAPEDVTCVVLTHLHFDHGGGLCRAGPEGPRLRFPRARVVVQRGEWEDAGAECPLCRASYVAEDTRLVAEAGLLEPLDGDAEVVPGVRVEVSGGHTRCHQVVRVQGGGETLLFWGDLLPTAAHLKPHWVMGYDLYPVQAWEAKERLMAQAVQGGWLQVLYHDPLTPWGRVVRAGRDYALEPAPA